MLNPYLWLIGLCLSLNAFAAEQAGKVVLSVGKNTAQLAQEPLRPLKRNAPVFVRDRIITGERGQLQLRLSDGSRVSLEQDTQFILQQHHYPADSPASGRAVYQLIKGGLRTLTGAISAAEPKNYELKTPIATIGVRGTHYRLFYCDRRCAETAGRPRGLWGEVLEGAILVITETAQRTVSAGEHFFLEDGQSEPIVQSEPFSETPDVLPSGLLEQTPETALPELDRNGLPGAPGLDPEPLTPSVDLEQAPLQRIPQLNQGDWSLPSDPARASGTDNY